MNEKTIADAMAYGRSLMRFVTGVECGEERQPQNWSPWTQRMFQTERRPTYALENVWSLVRSGERAPHATYLPMCEITTNSGGSQHEWRLFPTEHEAVFATAAPALGQEFVTHGGAHTGTSFEQFFSLMEKYASTLPCTYGEDGVSLFRQWALMTGIMAISSDGTPSGLPEKLGLIGLDLPGIQQTVYTITSRGAGKGVRGRSAFVQLLVNAVVDRILYDLDLCRGNVIVHAGGNALILCGFTAQLDQYLEGIDRELNLLLMRGAEKGTFSGFQGDLGIAFAYIEVPWSIVRYPLTTKTDDAEDVSEWQYYEKKLKLCLQAAKQRPLGGLLRDANDVRAFFQPDPIHSDRYCAVCRRPEPGNPPKKEHAFKAYTDDETADPTGAQPLICPVCEGMVDLARRLGKQGRYLVRQRSSTLPNDAKAWQAALFYASGGYIYDICATVSDHGVNLALTPDGFPDEHVQGFWSLARTTPMEGDEIRDNASLAEESPGTFKRIGVLKADVDWLSKILVTGLVNRRSVALTATLSESLSLFFGGWLDQICEEEEFRNRTYVLYAGGDDLLILGTWYVIPNLAARISGDFARYTGQNPGVHLSAGISIVGGKEPLYGAVEAAEKALKAAKRFPNEDNPSKNAISFMDLEFDWSHFLDVQEWEQKLRDILADGAPNALLTTLLAVYAQYKDDRRAPTKKISGYTTQAAQGIYSQKNVELYLGPWLWQMIYRLHRLAREDTAKEQILKVQEKLLTAQGVPQLALSARWAQLRSRKDA
jgi:CRISPR-associated protein Csm1